MSVKQKFAPFFLFFLIMGCTTNLPTKPPQIETKTAQTNIPIPISTSTLSPTATLEPSILENYSHVFAYVDGDEVVFLNENAKRITSVISKSGWIKDFKVSPDTNYIIYSSFDENTLLSVQRIGQEKIMQFSHQSKDIVYFDWLSNENFVILTKSGYFLDSLDGSEIEINSDINFSQPVDTRSFYSTIKSPSENNLLVLQSISTEEGKITGCAVYFLAHETGELKELIREDNYCYFDGTTNWSPDGNFAGINYIESTGSYGYTTEIFNVNTGEIIHANEEDAIYPYREISWSPDGAFFSFIRNTFTVVVQRNDFKTSEVILEQDFSIPPNNTLLWSPDGRFLMYGRQPKYMYIFDVNENKYNKMLVHDLKGLDAGSDNGNYWWSSNSDGIFIIPEDSNSELNGVYWYAINSNTPERIGDLIKLKFKPYLPNIEIKQSPNNQFSAIYIVSTNEDGTRYYNYFLLDEEMLQVTPVKETNDANFSSTFMWVK